MMKHLACIMDGNRRWAKKRGKLSVEGHKEGVETVKRVVRFCLDKKFNILLSIPFHSKILSDLNLKKIIFSI